MALTATEQVINNGDRNLTVKYTFNGTTGDVTVLRLVDVSALGATTVRIMRVHAVLTGFSASLIWDADANIDIMGFNEGEADFDYNFAGGLTNNAGTGVTGDILLRSDGYTAAAGEDNSYIYLELRKT